MINQPRPRLTTDSTDNDQQTLLDCIDLDADSCPKRTNVLNVALINTPLGPMIALGDSKAVYFLDFIDRKNLNLKINRLTKLTQSRIVLGKTLAIDRIENELVAYFCGKLNQFHTPLAMTGSVFQQKVWQALTMIALGETTSYKAQAVLINHPKAYRALANANNANPICIVIPCHRVIASSGQLSGYGGGVARKKWLLAFEAELIKN